MPPRKLPERDESLAYVETEALLNELLSRFDHCVFSGLIERGDRAQIGIWRRSKGHVYICSGLADEVGRMNVDAARRSAQRRRRNGDTSGGEF